MANYKGHIVGGFLAGAVYSAVLLFVPVAAFAAAAGVLDGWQAIVGVFIISTLFGLFPDVDTNSKAQDIFMGTAFVVDILLIISGELEAAAYLGLVAMTAIIGKHRGWTHSRWAMFVVPLPILLVPYFYNQAILPVSVVYYGAAVAGYFSHLLLDGLIWKRIRVKGGW